MLICLVDGEFFCNRDMWRSCLNLQSVVYAAHRMINSHINLQKNVASSRIKISITKIMGVFNGV